MIVVDDRSTDGTPGGAANASARSARAQPDSRIAWTFLRHERNQGKGGAVRTALARATCDITVIHDADLEYHPQRPAAHRSGVRRGARRTSSTARASPAATSRRVLLFRHAARQQVPDAASATSCTNLNLTDMETCYKAVRTEPRSSRSRSCPNDFRLEPELTIKLAKRQARIFEVPISYSGRTYQEGKKINWKDGVRARSGRIVRFALSDEVYKQRRVRQPDPGAPQPRAALQRVDGRHHPSVLRAARARDRRRRRQPHAEARSRARVRRRPTSTRSTCRRSPSLRQDRPYLRSRITATSSDVASFPSSRRRRYDTVICLNVDRARRPTIASALLQHPAARWRRTAARSSLVPQGQWNFGTLRRGAGAPASATTKRDGLRRLAEAAGFEVERILTASTARARPPGS